MGRIINQILEQLQNARLITTENGVRAGFVVPEYLMSFDEGEKSRLLLSISKDFEYMAINFPDGWHAYSVDDANKVAELLKPILK